VLLHHAGHFSSIHCSSEPQDGSLHLTSSEHVVCVVQSYLFAYIGFWHLGSIVVLVLGGCMTACGHMTYAQLTAAYLYSDHVFDSAKVVCDQAASVLENVGTVDTVLKYVLLFAVL
jgi:hypothetical protein